MTGEGRRVGVFGGSFNPPHVGHLALAAAAAEAARLEAVLWMPAATSPHKQGRADHVAAEHRLRMVERAVEGDPVFEVSDLEVRRAGVSYTVETLRQLRADYPGTEFRLIVGGDSLAGFATWREPEAIAELAPLVVYPRPGAVLDADAGPFLEGALLIEAPRIDLSSTELRARLAAGKSVRYLVPDSVLAYIAEHGLYAEG